MSLPAKTFLFSRPLTKQTAQAVRSFQWVSRLVPSTIDFATQREHHHERHVFHGYLGVFAAGVCSFWAISNVAAEKQDDMPVEDTSKYAKFKKKFVGSYENRLRAYSHPYKVFQYFASINRDGEWYMHPLDFIVSILPNQPSTMTGNSELLSKERKRLLEKKCASAIELFRLADQNGDGLISFSEYMFFLILLATPENNFRVAFELFDKDGNGFIDIDEFQNMISQMNSGAKQRMGTREKIHKISKRSGLIFLLFGKDGTDKCSFEKFSQFLKRLHFEVLKLEFFTYDVDQNETISTTDFARAIVSYAERGDRKAFENRIATMPPSTERVTLEDFAKFDAIVAQLENIQYAIQLYPSLNGFAKHDLKRAFKATANVDMPDYILDILFHLFDSNSDGTLDEAEFVSVLRGRFIRGLDNPRDFGISQYFNNLRNCWTSL